MSLIVINESFTLTVDVGKVRGSGFEELDMPERYVCELHRKKQRTKKCSVIPSKDYGLPQTAKLSARLLLWIAIEYIRIVQVIPYSSKSHFKKHFASCASRLLIVLIRQDNNMLSSAAESGSLS